MIYEGKAKKLSVEGDEVHMHFKDDATAFNGKKHEVIPGKGALNSAITELVFRYLSDRNIPNHYLGRIDERTLRVQKAEMFPLEAVVRFRVAGSLAKRTGLETGTPCEPAIVEFYYKKDELNDPILNDDHIRFLKLADPDQIATMRQAALAGAQEVQALAARANIHLVDLKFEYGLVNGQLVLADEVSPDTCRFHDMDSGQILDKDIFRQGTGNLLEAYEEVLARFRRAYT